MFEMVNYKLLCLIPILILFCMKSNRHFYLFQDLLNGLREWNKLKEISELVAVVKYLNNYMTFHLRYTLYRSKKEPCCKVGFIYLLFVVLSSVAKEKNTGEYKNNQSHISCS
jgi:hypothetical protein